MKFKALFYILLGLAVILWSFCGMVFMQDELSALFRLDFSSMSEVIDKGIRPDGHPAFVQVFLFLWTKLFGYSEWAVKLPSLVCGIASLWLTHRLARKFFDQHIALMAVALVAFSQYYVLYFTLARPYAYGTFFVLAQIYSLVQWRDKGGSPYSWTFIVFALLSAYTHYFSMLVSGIVTLWGFLWLKRSQYKAFMVSIALSIIFFSPHLPLSVHQLGIGGLGGPEGWLEAPNSDFPMRYLSYLAQYHLAGQILFIVAAVTTVLRLHKMTSDQGRFIVLGIGVLFIPLFIGYQYSVRINPVLQYSVLIFGSIPFLIVLLSGFKFFGTRFKTVMLLIVIGVTLNGLIAERHHARFSTDQPYETLVSFAELNPGATLIGDMDEGFIGQYKKSRDVDFEYFQSQDRSLSDIAGYLEGSRSACILIGARSELLPMISDLYDEGSCWEQRGTYETVIVKGSESESCGRPAIDIQGPQLGRTFGQEYGESFEMDLNDLNGYPFVTLMVTQPIDSISMTGGTMVSEIYEGDSLVRWIGRDVSEYSIPTKDGLNTYLSIRLQDVIDTDKSAKEYSWKVYYWNRAKEPVTGDPMRIRVFPDSPKRYGLFQEF